jgi:2-polyprenyl-3-methyl-5-hydroxy-6-metoxy-1,4-benzoquinol methylase
MNQNILRKLFRIINSFNPLKKNAQNRLNLPLKFVKNEWYVNERIVEIPFVLNNIDLEGKSKRVLEFGCARSFLAIQLASLGYEVTAIDLEDYKYRHPNLQFYSINIFDFEDEIGFDYITAISTIEHIGLGTYGDKPSFDDIFKISSKLSELLKPEGSVIITVPFGRKFVNNFYRSFTYDEILSLFKDDKLKLVEEQFYRRKNYKFWSGCSLKEAQSVSNAPKDRGPTGMNCVGCFIWKKMS